MDLYYDQLEYVFAEDNEKKIRHVAPAEPLIAPSTYYIVLLYLILNDRIFGKGKRRGGGHQWFVFETRNSR